MTKQKIYTYDELKEILRLHALWIRSEEGGKRADLSDSDLTDEKLQPLLYSANLYSANLESANLVRANLESANLYSANLESANLYSANLYSANLVRANLVRANLYSANLESANLESANLEIFKQDLIAEVLKLPDELENLKKSLEDGKIDGSSYSGECACLAGTIANNRGIEITGGETIEENGNKFKADSSSPREQWFMHISEGDTPATHQPTKLAHDWICEAISIRDHIRKTAKAA